MYLMSKLVRDVWFARPDPRALPPFSPALPPLWWMGVAKAMTISFSDTGENKIASTKILHLL